MADEHAILLPRAYYSAITVFLNSRPETILGALLANSEMAVEPPQRDAWLQEIAILKDSLQGLDGTLFLEFNTPRMGKHIDAVVVAGAIVFVIECKVGEKHFTRADLDQVWDYALDLKNFHEASHAVPILPILVATEAAVGDRRLPAPHEDQVYPPVQSNSHGIRLGPPHLPRRQVVRTAQRRSPELPPQRVPRAPDPRAAGHGDLCPAG